MARAPQLSHLNHCAGCAVRTGDDVPKIHGCRSRDGEATRGVWPFCVHCYAPRAVQGFIWEFFWKPSRLAVGTSSQVGLGHKQGDKEKSLQGSDSADLPPPQARLRGQGFRGRSGGRRGQAAWPASCGAHARRPQVLRTPRLGEINMARPLGCRCRHCAGGNRRRFRRKTRGTLAASRFRKHVSARVTVPVAISQLAHWAP